MFKALKYPLQDSCFKIEVLDEAVQEVFQREASCDTLETCIQLGIESMEGEPRFDKVIKDLDGEGPRSAPYNP